MKEIERSQEFSHYNHMGTSCCHGKQSTDQIWPKTLFSLIPSPMVLQMKYDFDRLSDLENVNERRNEPHPISSLCEPRMEMESSD